MRTLCFTLAVCAVTLVASACQNAGEMVGPEAQASSEPNFGGETNTSEDGVGALGSGHRIQSTNDWTDSVSADSVTTRGIGAGGSGH